MYFPFDLSYARVRKWWTMPFNKQEHVEKHITHSISGSSYLNLICKISDLFFMSSADVKSKIIEPS